MLSWTDMRLSYKLSLCYSSFFIRYRVLTLRARYWRTCCRARTRHEEWASWRCTGRPAQSSRRWVGVNQYCTVRRAAVCCLFYAVQSSLVLRSSSSSSYDAILWSYGNDGKYPPKSQRALFIVLTLSCMLKLFQHQWLCFTEQKCRFEELTHRAEMALL